jgi:hypothetical protein
MMIRKLLSAVLLLCAFSSVYAQGLEISAEVWARPHSGTSITALPGLQAVIEELGRQPASSLSISYPGGEEGAQWAYELRAWLIALGVSGQRIEMFSGGMSEPGLRLEVKDRAKMIRSEP